MSVVITIEHVKKQYEKNNFTQVMNNENCYGAFVDKEFYKNLFY